MVHKGLRHLIEHDQAAGLPAGCVPKLRRMISFLQDMDDESELRSMPNWKAHQLTGERKGTWSLFVTRNWRLAFWVDGNEIEIMDLNFEGYH